MRFLPALFALLPLCGQSVSLDSFGEPRILLLKGTVHHVQGVDLDDQHVWVTSVDKDTRKGFLHEFALDSGEMTRTIEIQQGERFHPGGITLDRDSLWIPIAEYRRNSSAIIQRRNKRTLELESQFEVKDHVGCVAVADGMVVGGNWDSRDLYVWDTSGTLRQKVANSSGNSFQDLKFDGGLLVGGGLLAGRTGAIDWVEFPSLKPVRRITAGKTDRGTAYTQEGMAVRNGHLYLLPEDGPTRLFIFDLAQGAGARVGAAGRR